MDAFRFLRRAGFSFIGNRPLLEYYIKFDVTLLNAISGGFGFELLRNPTIELADVFSAKLGSPRQQI